MKIEDIKVKNKNQQAPYETCRFFGLPARIRTADLQSRSLTRYPAVPQVDIQFFQVVLSVLKDLQSLPLAHAKRYMKGEYRGK